MDVTETVVFSMETLKEKFLLASILSRPLLKWFSESGAGRAVSEGKTYQEQQEGLSLAVKLSGALLACSISTSTKECISPLNIFLQ